MNTGKTHFNSESGKKAGEKSKRGKARHTLVKEMLEKTEKFTDIDELKEAVLLVFAESLESDSVNRREEAAKQISKYIFSTKTENKNTDMTIAEFIKSMKSKKTKEDEAE